ncbi:MAG: CHASE2 domain-containing protein [Prevotella sp.]|nr:CHASE2 domain-containing protein [Prevotella sp.]
MSKKADRTMKHYVMATIIAFCIVAIYALFAINLKILNPLVQALKEYSITDFYYQVIGIGEERDTSRIVTIVDMTELTDRRDIAYALREVQEQQPKVIGVDIVFEGLKPDNPEGDSLIAAVAASDTSTVFAVQYLDDSFDGEQFTKARQSFFADTIPHLKEALANMILDKNDGLKRQINLGKKVKGRMQPSMIKRLSDEYAEQEILPLKDKMMKINWAPIEFRVIPYDSVAYYGDYLTDRIVLFGAYSDLTDMHLTPNGKIPGIKLLAYGIETMVKQTNIKDAPWWITAILSFFIVLFTKLLFDKADKFVKSRKNRFLRIGLKTALVMGILKFLWMSLIMYIGFIVFARFNISINLAWALSAIAFTGAAADLYNVIYQSFSKKEESL